MEWLYRRTNSRISLVQFNLLLSWLASWALRTGVSCRPIVWRLTTSFPRENNAVFVDVRSTVNKNYLIGLFGQLPTVLPSRDYISHSLNQRCFCQAHARLCQSIADVFHKLSPIIQWLNCRVDCTVHTAQSSNFNKLPMTVHSVDCSWFLSSQFI